MDIVEFFNNGGNLPMQIIHQFDFAVNAGRISSGIVSDVLSDTS